MDSDWTLSPLDFDWTLKSGLESSQSPVDWTGLDLNPVDWELYQPVWPESGLAGVHWSPLESTGIYLDYVGEGEDLEISVISAQESSHKSISGLFLDPTHPFTAKTDTAIADIPSGQTRLFINLIGVSVGGGSGRVVGGLNFPSCQCL